LHFIELFNSKHLLNFSHFYLFIHILCHKTNNLSRVYISFSGGKDSTVLLHLVRSMYPDTLAVYADTGLEYPEIKEFVRTIDNVDIVYPCEWSKEQRQYIRTNFKKVLEKYGYPVVSKRVSEAVKFGRNAIEKNREDESFYMKLFNQQYFKPNGDISYYCNISKYKFLLDAPFEVSDKCCYIMKENPLKQYGKQNNVYPYVGTMASEGGRRKDSWLMAGCNVFNGNDSKSKPLSFWTEQDIFEYIKRFDIPYCSIYGDILKDKNDKWYCTGEKRTGCMYCLYGIHLDKSPNRLEKMKETHPSIYEWCMKSWDAGGLGLKDVIDWMNENGDMKKKIKY